MSECQTKAGNQECLAKLKTRSFNLSFTAPTLDMLNNFYFDVYAQKPLSHSHTLSMSGHAEDDYHVTGYRSTGRCETGPPGGRYSATRVAGMLGDVAAVLSRILAIVANDSDVKADKAFNTDGAVIKNGKD